jgi:hypothetical protein
MEIEPDHEATSDLSASDLQDLVVAARPANQAEALFIVDLLEEAGIPVVSNQDNVYGFSGAHAAGELRVPRALLAKAQSAIGNARSKAAEQRINLAFEPESVLDSLEDERPDPVMIQMAELRNYSDAERDAALRECVKQWIMKNETPEVLIAKYLAAAGLKEQQAREMVESVAKVESDVVESAHSSRFLLGIGQLSLGLLLLLIRSAIDSQSATGRVWSYAPVVLIIGGLVTICISLESKPVSTLSGPRPPGPDREK